ncbi:glutathione S-transferase family protein [Neptunicella sp. SCSIO 80796]|uniref:glutathione S-transferase family protein n=1 Tax=Neptunicella plasticusilytica TaxID=3117012 RepID=UPI003A4D6FD8
MSKVNSSWKSSIDNGEYHRKDSQFRSWITADGDSGFKAEADRYHLYVSLACPWAHRALVFRVLKGLQDLIAVSVVHPDMHDKGWRFKHNAKSSRLYATTGDTLYGSEYLSDLYYQHSADYQGNITVPVLWDQKQRVIVNNESADIIRMFNSAFDHITGNQQDFYPSDLQSHIDEINHLVYHNVNNGVYKTGFATSQDAYDENAKKLFSVLQQLDTILASQRYLTGPKITEADWRLWTTLVRFDAVYHTHFKCNLKLLKEFEHLYHFMLELYQQPGIAQTVNMNHIKRHYYASHETINPHRIIPLGHQQDWNQPHQRDKIG